MRGMNFNDITIGFIGAGNMATALIEGLLAQGQAASHLWASDTDTAKLDAFAARGLQTTRDNRALVKACDLVVLAVKPQIMDQVLAGLDDTLEHTDCLLVSIAAGIRISSIEAATRSGQAIVRCMPNTPALVREGATGLYANSWVSAEQRTLALGLLQAVGKACWLDNEDQIDAVTALSGSGPAYFFLLMEAMQDAAVQLGLPPDIARELCLQTALGSARLALASDVDVAELRRRVTSPNGTTEAAIQQFEREDLRAIVARALGKAAERSKELSGE
jgi:pyrroline-5-carboxylate reductase